MNGPQFFMTRMGQVFFEGTMPRLYRSLERLADVLGGQREYRVVQVTEDLEDTLNELAKQGFVYRETLSSAMVPTVLMERVIPREQG